MHRRYKRVQVHNIEEPLSKPFKWFLGIALLTLGLTFTTAEVGGDGVGNPYIGGHTDKEVLENIFALPEAKNLDGKKTIGEIAPNLLKRR